MATLYKPHTIALAKLAALPRYQHPADLAHEYRKPISEQMKAINGEFEFGKGYYHTPHYQNLMKGVKDLRGAWRQSPELKLRQEKAEKQINLWEDYVKKGVEQLPVGKKIDEKKHSQLFQTYTVCKQRNEESIACHRMLTFHNEYAKAFKMDIELHPKILLKMVHPHFGYMLLFKRNITLPDLIGFYHRMLFASQERYNGNTLHSDELTAYNFWRLYTTSPHLSTAGFCDLLGCFKFNVKPETFHKQFSYSLNRSPNEVSRDIPSQEQIYRFDFFRQIFLERGL